MFIRTFAMAEMKQKSTLFSIPYQFLNIGFPNVGFSNTCVITVEQ